MVSEKDGKVYDLTSLFVFDREAIPDYIMGQRQVDVTTIARAAEAGELDFLKWCRSEEGGHADCFDSTALGYAAKGRQLGVIEWMLGERVTRQWEACHLREEKLKGELRKLGIRESLLENMPNDSLINVQ